MNSHMASTSAHASPSSPRRAMKEASAAALTTTPVSNRHPMRAFVSQSEFEAASLEDLNRWAVKGKGVDRNPGQGNDAFFQRRSPVFVPPAPTQAPAAKTINAERSANSAQDAEDPEADVASPYVRPSRMPLMQFDIDGIARRFGAEAVLEFEREQDPARGKDSGTKYTYPPPRSHSPNWLTTMEHGLEMDGLCLERELSRIRAIAESSLVESTLAVAEIDDELREYEALLRDLGHVAGDDFVKHLEELADKIKLPAYVEDDYPADPPPTYDMTEDYFEYDDGESRDYIARENDDPTMEDEQLSDTFSYLNPPTSPLANKSAKRRRDTEDEDDEAVNQLSAKRRRSKAPAPPSPAQSPVGLARRAPHCATEGPMSGHDITTPPKATRYEDYPASFPTSPFYHRGSSRDPDHLPPSSPRPPSPPQGSPRRRAQSCPLPNDGPDAPTAIDDREYRGRDMQYNCNGNSSPRRSYVEDDSEYSDLVSPCAPCPTGWRMEELRKKYTWKIVNFPPTTQIVAQPAAPGVDKNAAEGSGVDRSAGLDGDLEMGDAADEAQDVNMADAGVQSLTFQEQEDILDQILNEEEAKAQLHAEQQDAVATESSALQAAVDEEEPEAERAELPVTPPRKTRRRAKGKGLAGYFRPTPSPL
ncbi:hypothetical protein C2E23DRAFT_841142 [Lenzites betulinus]|nr:hypothetical protein C2E23DRAFT_841142 [Lenzites betulinus]